MTDLSRYQPAPLVRIKHPEWSKNATIYQINTRQFTAEGTFRAAETLLDSDAEIPAIDNVIAAGMVVAQLPQRSEARARLTAEVFRVALDVVRNNGLVGTPPTVLGVEIQPEAAPTKAVAAPAQLPATGSSDAVPLVAIGAGIVVAGALLVAVRRIPQSS